MNSAMLLASGVTLTGSAVASTYTARIGGMIGHKLSVIYTPGTDSTNALNLTIETSNDGDEVADSDAKWDVLELWANSAGTLTKTNFLLSLDSAGTSAQTADLLFNKPAQRLRVKYSETNTPTPFGTISVFLSSFSTQVTPNIASSASIAGTVTVDTQTMFTDDAAFTPGTSKVQAIGFQADETSADSVDEGDIGAPRMTLDRRVRVASKATDGPGEPVIDSYGHVAINLAAGNNQVLVASAANKQIWVYGYHIMVNVAGTVSFQDEDDTAISGIMPFGDKGGAAISPSGNFSMPIWKLATDKDLEVDVVTSELDGWLSYAIVSV